MILIVRSHSTPFPCIQTPADNLSTIASHPAPNHTDVLLSPTWSQGVGFGATGVSVLVLGNFSIVVCGMFKIRLNASRREVEQRQVLGELDSCPADHEDYTVLLERAFRLFDVTRTGALSGDEVRDLLVCMFPSLPRQLVSQFVHDNHWLAHDRIALSDFSDALEAFRAQLAERDSAVTHSLGSEHAPPRRVMVANSIRNVVARPARVLGDLLSQPPHLWSRPCVASVLHSITSTDYPVRSTTSADGSPCGSCVVEIPAAEVVVRASRCLDRSSGIALRHLDRSSGRDSRLSTPTAVRVSSSNHRRRGSAPFATLHHRSLVEERRAEAATLQFARPASRSLQQVTVPVSEVGLPGEGRDK